jgi:hypothetical protein
MEVEIIMLGEKKSEEDKNCVSLSYKTSPKINASTGV